MAVKILGLKVLGQTEDRSKFVAHVLDSVIAPANRRKGLEGVEVMGDVELISNGSVVQNYNACFSFDYLRNKNSVSKFIWAYAFSHEREEGEFNSDEYIEEQIRSLDGAIMREPHADTLYYSSVEGSGKDTKLIVKRKER